MSDAERCETCEHRRVAHKVTTQTLVGQRTFYRTCRKPGCDCEDYVEPT